MRVISVNAGLPRTVQWNGKAVSTGIFKAPVSGRIHLRTLNFDGDRQADLSVHGAGPRTDRLTVAGPKASVCMRSARTPHASRSRVTDSLAASRRTSSQLGQILHSCRHRTRHNLGNRARR